MAKKKEDSPVVEDEAPEFVPTFKAEPISSALDWWPHTARYLRVLRNKKTGQLRLDHTVCSIKPVITPGMHSNIPGHEVMMLLDLTELLKDK